MRNVIALASALVSVACGNGASHELAPPPSPGRPPAAIVVDGPCTNTPEDCGVKICIDCTADAPPGTVAACVSGRCTFLCAPGFHRCGAECLADTDPANCGPSCTTCGAPAYGTPVCASGVCDFACDPGFAKGASACLSLSFSVSY